MGEFNRKRYIFSNESKVVDVGEKAIKLREEQIFLMVEELLSFKVLVRDLVSHFPSDKERNLILNIAHYLIEDVELFDKFMERKELPFNKLASITKVSREFLERWQDYLLAYIIIFSNPNYKHIQDVLKVDEVNEKGVVKLLEGEKSNIYRGIVIQANKRTSIILNSSGQFIKIKKSEQVGHSAEGEEKKGLAHFRFYIALAMILLAILCFAAYKDYNHPYSTVVINTTSQIKLEINRGNRVVDIYSQADKGKGMVKAVSAMDKKIDDALKACIEYAYENDMIPNDGILVTITGKPLKYGELDKTGNYVVDKKIQIRINNAGSMHNIYESIEIERKEENK